MPCIASVMGQVMRHTEGHDRLDTGAGITLDFAGQPGFGNTHDTRHGFDRDEIIDFFLDEDRQYQIIEAQLSFLKHRAKLIGPTKTAWARKRERTGHLKPRNKQNL